jgi:hypothetical protein
MSTSGPRSYILPHDPLTPVTTPTPEVVRRLREELYANAQSVVTTLGGGRHGHLGMIMPAADYTKLSNGGAEYIFPTEPPIPTYSKKEKKNRQQSTLFDMAMDTYKEASALHNQLKAQLLQAIPTCYRAVLAQRTIGYANVTPQAILAHMLKRYGKITPQDLTKNIKALEAPWDPDTTIDTVFINGTACREFAEEGGEPITDQTYLRVLVATFRKSGVMDDAVRDWEKKPEDQKTVDTAIEHFTEADHFRLESQEYLKSALTVNPTAQASAPATTTGDALLTGTTRPPQAPASAHRANLNLQGWSYCWTHGVAQHHSRDCRAPKEGHIKEATIDEPQGGSMVITSRRNNTRNTNRRNKKRKTEATSPPEEEAR